MPGTYYRTLARLHSYSHIPTHSLPTTLATKKERYPGCYKTLHPQDNKPVTVNAFYSAKKWWAQKDAMDNHNNTATFGTDAFNETLFNVFIQTADEATTSDAVAVEVKITYIAKLTEPKDILGS